VGDEVVKTNIHDLTDFLGQGESILTLEEIVSNDIRRHTENSGSQKEQLRSLSESSGLGLRTLYRYLQQEVTPSPSSLMKLYVALHPKIQNREVFEAVIPSQILEAIKDHPHYRYITFSGKELSEWFERNMLEDKLFRAIFLRISESSKARPCTKEWVTIVHGQNGLDVLKDMIAHKAVKDNSGDRLVVNESAIPSWSGKLIAEVAKETLNNNLISENTEIDGSNAVGLKTKSVNKETYLEIQRRMQSFYLEIEDLMEKEENHGDMSAFFVIALDTKK